MTKGDAISLNLYSPSFFTSKGLGLDQSLSHSSTCCFHNESCLGNLSSSNHVSSSKSAWCSLCLGIASFTFGNIEVPIQEVNSLWNEGKKEQTQPDEFLPIPITHIVVHMHIFRENLLETLVIYST